MSIEFDAGHEEKRQDTALAHEHEHIVTTPSFFIFETNGFSYRCLSRFSELICLFGQSHYLDPQYYLLN